MDKLFWETKKIKVKDLKTLDFNPRKITEDKRQKLIKSLEKFNLAEIPAVNTDMVVVGGNQRVFAMTLMGRGEEEIDVRMPNRALTEAELKEYAIISNTHAGEWDVLKLDEFFEDVNFDELGFDMKFDVFDQEEENTVIEEAPEAKEDDYEIPAEIKTDIVLGDLFEIGDHRLLCGDSTCSDTVAKLMNGAKADITFTSPPYNVGRTPNGNDKKYLNDSDNRSKNVYVEFLDNFTKNGLLFSHYVFSNIQSLAGNKNALIEHLYNLNEFYADVMIWDKMTAEPAMAKRVLNSRFEYVYIFSKEAKRTIGKKDFWGTIDNVFSLNSRQGKDYAKFHKATFTVQLPFMFIENFTEKSVLDLFCGTGTTMVAAHQLKRICYGMELDPKYCQLIIDRMRKLDPSLIIKRNGEVWN